MEVVDIAKTLEEKPVLLDIMKLARGISKEDIDNIVNEILNKKITKEGDKELKTI